MLFFKRRQGQPPKTELQNNKDVPSLISDLTNAKDKETRIRSIITLGEFGHRFSARPEGAPLVYRSELIRNVSTITDPLITALSDNDSDVTKFAFKTLVEIWPATQSGLVDKIIQNIKLFDLSCQARSIRNIRQNIASSNNEVKIIAYMVLGRIQDRASVKSLIMAIVDVDMWVRIAAAESLGLIRDQQAVEPLITLLGDNEWRVRAAAVDALGNIGDIRGIEPLIKLIEDMSLCRDDVLRVQEHVVEALGNFGDFAVEPLLKFLQYNESHCSVSEPTGQIGGGK